MSSQSLPVSFFSLKCCFLVFFYLFEHQNEVYLREEREEGSDVWRVNKGGGELSTFYVPGSELVIQALTSTAQETAQGSLLVDEEAVRRTEGSLLRKNKEFTTAFKIICCLCNHMEQGFSDSDAHRNLLGSCKMRVLIQQVWGGQNAAPADPGTAL